jgi:Predicted oxidoreductases (related to aryl-alcohol dehydrogenases)
MPMSWGYSVDEADDGQIRETLHRAIELGVTLLDTADVYGPYTNEEIIGRFVVAEGLRDRVQIATKVGLTPIDTTTYGRDGSPEHVRSACDASLRRLGVEEIDLYQLHRIDPQVPVEETWGAMADLVATGKVRFLGMSEVAVEEIQRAATVHPVAAVHCEVSIWTRDNIDNGVVGYCEESGIGILAYSPPGPRIPHRFIDCRSDQGGGFPQRQPEIHDGGDAGEYRDRRRCESDRTTSWCDFGADRARVGAGTWRTCGPDSRDDTPALRRTVAPRPSMSNSLLRT